VKGVNVKLASISSGWKIDVTSISDAKEQGIRYRRLDSDTESDNEN
jgi:N utilization substance protein A